MVSALGREFALHESALLALSTSPLLASKDLLNFHAQAVSELKYIDADSVLLLVSSGQMLLNTRRQYGQALPKLEKTATHTHYRDWPMGRV